MSTSSRSSVWGNSDWTWRNWTSIAGAAGRTQWSEHSIPYGELTNCTYLIALKMDCFWPNRLVDDFFIRIHRHYFHDCSLSGRLLRDPPNRILGPFIVVPILVTLLMTALVVWRSKRSEGMV
ncbi:receptor activity-modifying protein 1 isoform X2 [Oncorhynchus masou masou]|uniref:receptor activity-modifying protein 1 isoform X2 n=1 Tax=Oncorhynchus masou masou TaxID=90313 RepID=UPI0031832471